MSRAVCRHAAMVLLLAAVVAPAAAQVGDCSAVPGWKQKGDPRSFEPDNLFDYINGNAEAYLLYHFVGMKGVTCVSGDVTVLIDVSEMADAEYAFGIFSANRDPRKPVETIGTAGQVLPRKATFAKDRFYVEVAANPEGDHSAVLRQFALDLEKRIRGRTAQPEALGWFPTDGLLPGSVRLIPESVLGIRLLTRGYVGLYEFGKGFVVETENQDAATRLMAKLKERFGQTSPAALGEEGFTATDRYLDGVCFFRKGKFVGGFSNLKGRDGVEESAALVAKLP